MQQKLEPKLETPDKGLKIAKQLPQMFLEKEEMLKATADRLTNPTQLLFAFLCISR
jgi:hypothetical protein